MSIPNIFRTDGTYPYFDPYPDQSFFEELIEDLLDEDLTIPSDIDELNLLNQSQKLSESDRSAFVRHIHKIANDILHQLSFLSAKGYSDAQIKQVAKESINKLKSSAEIFLIGCASYSQSKNDLMKSMHTVENKIKSTHINFSDFELPPSEEIDQGKKKINRQGITTAS